MPLPALTHWETHPTRTSLHHTARLLSELRRAYTSPQPMALHLACYITSTGLTTSKTSAGEFTLNFAESTLNYQPLSGDAHRFPLSRYADTGALREAVLQAASAYQPINAFRPTDDTKLEIDLTLAHEYHLTFQIITDTLARTRGWLHGTLSPLVVWAHGFDVSNIWFKKHDLDENQPHIALGFSPGSTGFARPYVYMYASPMPENFTALSLPKLAHWTTASWKGAVIDYDTLRTDPQPAASLHTTLMAIYEILAARL